MEKKKITKSKTPKTPKTLKSSKSSKTLKSSKSSKTLKSSKSSKSSKTPKISKTSKISKTPKISKTSKSSKTKKQRGGSNLPNAAINTVKSMINLGKNIGQEIDALFHMGSDFNKATNVKLPNEYTPDQSVTSTSANFTQPTYPKAKV